MDIQILSQAKERVPNIPLLINIVSKRVRQLNAGHRPLIKPDPNMANMDVALTEVAEGKLTAEMAFTPAARPDGDNIIQL